MLRDNGAKLEGIHLNGEIYPFRIQLRPCRNHIFVLKNINNDGVVVKHYFQSSKLVILFAMIVSPRVAYSLP